MNTIELQVYKFDELKDNVKQQLIHAESNKIDCDFVYSEFMPCVYKFLDLFNIDNHQLDYSIDPWDYSYLNITNVENKSFNNFNKKFINSLDDNFTGVCYGIDLIRSCKEHFSKTNSVKLSVEFALAYALKGIISELQAMYEHKYLIERIIDKDYNYLEDGRLI